MVQGKRNCDASVTSSPMMFERRQSEWVIEWSLSERTARCRPGSGCEPPWCGAAVVVDVNNLVVAFTANKNEREGFKIGL